MAKWIDACDADDIDAEDVIRFDHGGQRLRDLPLAPTTTSSPPTGSAPTSRLHLADGLVMDEIIECPKHNGRFDYRPARPRARRSASTSGPIR